MAIQVTDLVEMLLLSEKEKQTLRYDYLYEESQKLLKHRSSAIAELQTLLNDAAIKQNPGWYQIAEFFSVLSGKKIIVVDSPELIQETAACLHRYHNTAFSNFWVEQLFGTKKENYTSRIDYTSPINPISWHFRPHLVEVSETLAPVDEEPGYDSYGAEDEMYESQHIYSRYRVVALGDYLVDRQSLSHLSTVRLDNPPMELYDKIRAIQVNLVAVLNERDGSYPDQKWEAATRARLTAKVTQLLIEKAGLMPDFQALLVDVFQEPVVVQES